jgi:hypothetical protein
MEGNWENSLIDDLKEPTPNAVAMAPFGYLDRTENSAPQGRYGDREQKRQQTRSAPRPTMGMSRSNLGACAS